MRITVIVGNPKPQSRTLDAANLLAEQIVGRAPDAVIDVVTLGIGLLGWGDAGVADAVRSAGESDLVIVASPTYKGSYTGVLKTFLDHFDGGTGLGGVVAVPLMLGAAPTHALAPDLLLKPVLVELGAIVPVQGLYLNEKTYREADATEAWLSRWRGTLLQLLPPADLLDAHPPAGRSDDEM